MTVQPLAPEDSEEEDFAAWAWAPPEASSYCPWVWEHALMLADAPEASAVETVLEQVLPGWGQQVLRAWPTFLDAVLAQLPQLAPQMVPYLTAPQGSDSPCCLELVWVDDASMQELNREWRGKDAPTDVLTYSAIADSDADTLPPLLPGCPVVLGTVVLNMAWALRQAALPDVEATSVDWHQVLGLSERSSAEAQQLLVSRYVLTRLFHGCLHVLGLHHDTDEAYARIVAIQDAALCDAFGVIHPPSTSSGHATMAV